VHPVPAARSSVQAPLRAPRRDPHLRWIFFRGLGHNRAVRSFVPVTIDATWIAIESASVREIGGPLTWIALPTAGAMLPGVTGWRGQAVAVVDLAAVLGVGARLASPAGRARTLYLSVGGNTLAVPVDAVRGPIALADDDVRPPRARTEAFCVGETDIEGHTALVVELGVVIDGVRPPTAPVHHP
jgi:chemotaxis signal transduction protein